MEVLYLHGFASSAQSSKGAYFAEKLRAHGIALAGPDFNAPDFTSLTITRMLDQVGAAVDAAADAPVALVGSSLGGFVAVQAAACWPARIDRLVLLAPAVDLRAERIVELGDRALEEWKATGRTNIFHYGFGRVMPVGYALYEDAARYDSLHAAFGQPTLVFQGRHDTAVNPHVVEQWAAARPNVELHLLDDDHQLHASLDYIWEKVKGFLLS